MSHLNSWATGIFLYSQGKAEWLNCVCITTYHDVTNQKGAFPVVCTGSLCASAHFVQTAYVTMHDPSLRLGSFFVHACHLSLEWVREGDTPSLLMVCTLECFVLLYVYVCVQVQCGNHPNTQEFVTVWEGLSVSILQVRASLCVNAHVCVSEHVLCVSVCAFHWTCVCIATLCLCACVRVCISIHKESLHSQSCPPFLHW